MRTKEQLIEKFLAFCALLTVLTTLGIILVLLFQTISFFREVSFIEFFTNTQWTPLSSNKNLGILPLITGTFLISFLAIAVALPVGLTIAIYLNEYSYKGFRKTIKPLLEILAAVPTVVYGFFALTFVSPFLKVVLGNFGVDLGTFNALSAGLVMGIMIIPFVSSLSEDALFAVPKGLREAAYSMGATRFQTAFRVTVPAASSGIVVSVILAISRAIGETMIVAIAAGHNPTFTLNPTSSVETITAYIVRVAKGDVPHGTIEYKTIFAAGITLFVLTFILNNISYWIKKRYQEQYE